MTNILLTGAGFTRNWGGWLANEAFEYVLGRVEVGDELRARLWAGKAKRLGFEETLAELQEQQARGAPRAAEMLNGFMMALVAMFNEMNQGLYQAQFEPQQAHHISDRDLPGAVRFYLHAQPGSADGVATISATALPSINRGNSTASRCRYQEAAPAWPYARFTHALD